ncbi:MAG: guanylate kinase [Candidatus Latescibacteria bacterium]|nr:guanylate kinase [bacterium]MBD3422820.1 guanylate kinase [Candidatus Latescibacterota bacterium]
MDRPDTGQKDQVPGDYHLRPGYTLGGGSGNPHPEARRQAVACGGIAIIDSTEPFVTVISGPSGVGKSTIADRVLRLFENMRRSISYTTRPPREGEKEGENYFFVSEGRFRGLIEDGSLIEWAEVYGNLYGTGIEYVSTNLEQGWNLLLEIDIKGGESVKGKLPRSVLIMVVPPSLEALEQRLRGRKTDREGDIRRRLDNAISELRHWSNYDYVVINDRLEDAVERVRGIIRSEMARSSRIKMIKSVDKER